MLRTGIPIAGTGQTITAADSYRITGVWNALGYGLDPTGTIDAGSALQSFVNMIDAAGGGIGFVPPGDYQLASLATTGLNVPKNVGIVGSYLGPFSHNGFRDGNPYPTGGGTRFLMPVGGTADWLHAYITLNSNSVLKGCYLYAPGQLQTLTTPIASPPWVAMRGKNPSIIECQFLNPYWAVDINNPSDGQVTERPTVRDLTGQPIAYGITCGDQGHNGIADVARFEGIHFNPWFSGPNAGTASNLYNWAQVNGIAFRFGDMDEFVAQGCFVYGYKIGFHAVQGAVSGAGIASRGPYGSWMGGGIDACNAGVQIDKSQLQAPTRFTGIGNVSAYAASAGNNHNLIINGGAGNIIISDFGGWGVAVETFLEMHGPNTLILNAGTIQTWNTQALNVFSGRVGVNMVDFMQSGRHIATVGGTVALGTNFFKGGLTYTGATPSTGSISY